MLIYNYLTTFAVIAIILISLLHHKFRFKFIENLNNAKWFKNTNDFCIKYYKYICIFVIFIGIFFSIYEIDKLPIGLHVDEAGMAYDAMSLSNFSVDRYLNHLPVYLINFGGGQSAMYAYLASIFISIFGYSITVIRLPAILLKIAILICGFFILRKNNNKLYQILLLLLISITPYFIMFARFGLDCNLLLGFTTIGITFLIEAFNQEDKTKQKNKIILLILSSTFFGLALYNYALSYLILPLMLALICIYLLYIGKLKFKELIIFSIPVFILALPLMLMLLVNNGYIDQIDSFITIPKLLEYRGSEISPTNINENFYIIKSIFSFDKDPALTYNSSKEFGTIYYCLIPLFITGVIYSIKNILLSIKNKYFCIDTIMCFYGISVLICQLLIINPNINKANAIFLPILYFIVIGIVNIVKNLKLLIIPILLILIINFSLFVNYYFNDYNKENYNTTFFATAYLEALEYCKTINDSNIVVYKNIAAQEYIYINLLNNISPYNFNKEIINVPLENEAIKTYLVKKEKDILNDILDLSSTNNNIAYIVPTTSKVAQELFKSNQKFKTFDYITVFYN